jgi:hypothetical protein
MKVEFARAVAKEWVIKNASQEDWFLGAYFSGSTIDLTDEAELPANSDVDVMIVTQFDEPPLKLGKFLYQGTLLEVTYLSWNQFTSSRKVMASYHIANSFRVDTIIADPTGELSKLQRKVSHHFTDLVWVRRRCDDAMKRVENGLRSINTSAPLHEQVTSWLFPTGVTTHVILVAGLRNPTIRLRYLKAQKVLIEYRQASRYPDLLELLGCARLTQQKVENHLTELVRVFDAAVEVARTPFFFSTDITKSARNIAINGSQELIRSGFHREAVFWIVATFARCQTILAADAPSLQCTFAPAFKALLSDLNINSNEDIIGRAEDVFEYLPKLKVITEDILSINPIIK